LLVIVTAVMILLEQCRITIALCSVGF